MRISRAFLVAFVLAAAPAAGQAPEIPCAAVKTATLPPCDAPAAKATPSALATIEGGTVGLADLDAELRKKIDGVEAAVAAARRGALEAEIADVRLHLEAERRSMTFPAFWEAEVLRKTAPPSDADLKAEFERVKKWYPGKSLDDIRGRLAPVVAARNRQKREEEVASSLAERYPAAPGADPNAPGLAKDAVLATVGGRTITAASAATRLDAAGYGVRREVWYEEMAAVEDAVMARLLATEAERRGTTPEALRKAEIDGKIVPPTADDLAKEWEKTRAGLKGSFEDNRAALTEEITRRRRETLERDFEKVLKAGRAVAVRVEEPAPPVLALDLAGAPSRGTPDAKATLVEYADFECPHCARGYAQAEELLKTYGDRVRYVVRNFPLPFHEHALKAAEAALAAHAQGRFFEIAGLLFRHQDALDTPSLGTYAREAGCDPARFGADLDSGRFAVAALLEERDGDRVGVAWTPSFFVNGVPVTWDGTVASLRKALDAVLVRAGGSRPAPAGDATASNAARP